jgi:1-acyl-sn-glycerol-3-phosphate acyltransferase
VAGGGRAGARAVDPPVKPATTAPGTRSSCWVNHFQHGIAVQRSLAKRVWYSSLRMVCRLVAVLVFRIRCHGREHIPREGGALVLANHQSHFDSVLVGLACHRRLNYLARETLFRFAPFRWLIRSLDAIPIDREGLGLSGLKETLRRVRHGEMVLVFPEGTRTRDGRLGPLRAGFYAVARRAGVPLLPVAVDGAFDAWPRWRRFPRPAVIRVEFGPPLLPDQVARMTEEQLVCELQARLRDCLDAARRKRLRSSGRT